VRSDISKNFLSSVDYNNTGDLDVIINGKATNSSYSTYMYDYAGVGQMKNPIINPGTANGILSWGDYDNDSDLDYFLSGLDSDGNNYSELVQNNFQNVNTPPSAPSNLKFECRADTVFISWDQATDVQTPSVCLSYNCYMYENGGDTIWHSMSNQKNGKRYIP
jgi:hypothetical protein